MSKARFFNISFVCPHCEGQRIERRQKVVEYSTIYCLCEKDENVEVIDAADVVVTPIEDGCDTEFVCLHCGLSPLPNGEKLDNEKALLKWLKENNMAKE